ncbi:MAG: holin [Ilumatobacteraceae bacterium]
MSLTRFQRDVLERAVRTFLQSALAVVAVELANPNVTLDSLQAATIAGVAAGVSALMAWLGRFIGDPDNGSWQEP